MTAAIVHACLYNYKWNAFYRGKTRDFPKEHGDYVIKAQVPSDRTWYFKDPPGTGHVVWGYVPLLRTDVTRITGLRRGVPMWVGETVTRAKLNA